MDPHPRAGRPVDASLFLRPHGGRNRHRRPGLAAERPAARRERRRSRPCGGVLGRPHFPATAKRVIYLSMNGAPSQLETFDYKPKLTELFDADLPDSVRMGQRITTMTSGQKRLPIAPSVFKFGRHGQRGRLGQRAVAAPGKGRRRPGDRADGQHRRDQSRPGVHVRFYRRAAAGPAQHGCLGLLRSGKPERKLAHVRGAAFHLELEARRTGRLLAPVGLGLPAVEIPGGRAAFVGRSGAVSFQSARRRLAPRAAECSMRWPSSTRRSLPPSAIRRSTRGSPNTRWPTGCRRRSPS